MRPAKLRPALFHGAGSQLQLLLQDLLQRGLGEGEVGLPKTWWWRRCLRPFKFYYCKYNFRSAVTCSPGQQVRISKDYLLLQCSLRRRDCQDIKT